MSPARGASVNAVESATPLEMAFAHYLVQAGWVRSIPESRSQCIVAEAGKTLGIDERKCEEMLWLDRVQRYMDKCRKRLPEAKCRRRGDSRLLRDALHS
jgi:hypothetical protein